MKSADVDRAYDALAEAFADSSNGALPCATADAEAHDLARVADLASELGLKGDMVDGMRRIVSVLELLARNVQAADAKGAARARRLSGALTAARLELE